MNDVKSTDGPGWIYSQMVKEHFFNPRNIVSEDVPQWDWDGEAEVGSPACGDVMKMWIKVEGNKIVKAGWKTFGCASAIASTSILSEMITEDGGMDLDRAYKITARDIIEKLGGLPKNKIHCSVLGDQALRKAIDDFRNN